jgi:uncharacterized FlaG/YvyC family protein
MCMNIKSVVKQVIPFTSVARKEVAHKELQTENQTERDANGSAGGSYQNPGRKLREGEVVKVLEALAALPGFKDNNLRAEVTFENGQHIFKIIDPTDKVIRRIVELEASKLLHSQDSIKGQIFNRAL